VSGYVLDFARPDEWISSNAREHWAVKARKTRIWRDTVAVMARAQQIPHMDRVELVYAPSFAGNRRRDAHNLTDTFKACTDGLVDAGVIDDDRDEIVVRMSVEVGPKITGTARLRITVIDRAEES
jgi:crossover junction endodeoxyribonuclease RusA